MRDLIAEPLRRQALAVVQRLAQADVVAPYRLVRLAKDGRNVEVWLTATALVNAAGQVYAIATTERKCEAANPAVLLSP
jgi:two-component system CheB/CheR fusion protein